MFIRQVVRKRLGTQIMHAVMVALASAMTSSISSASAQGIDLEAALSADAAARATAVSGPMISVSPLGLDFGIVNIGETESRSLTVQNVGDAELEIVSLQISDPQLTTDAPLPLSIAPGGSFTASATYTPTGGPLAGTLEFQSNSINGPYRTNATGRGNWAPVLEPIGNISAIALFPVRFAVTTTDLDLDPVTLSVDGLPSGATFDAGTGDFAWTPGIQDEGVHTLTFAATDGFATDTEAVEITVAVLNHPPVADPGGPYSGVVGAPVQFDGSGSSDPDGNVLAFSWGFGDGATGTGMNPTHPYAFGGEYSVGLRVTDDGLGNLTRSTMTTASIRGVTTGFGTATMDGTLAPGEWDSAHRFDFRANVPASEGGGTTAATLRVMNNESNLYAAIVIARPSFGGATSAFLEFDNNADGQRQDGDDVFGMNVGGFLPAEFVDDYRFHCPEYGPECPGCAPGDADVLAGFPPPGTTDGATAARNDGVLTVIEISHPLDSSDDLHDFSLRPGDRTSFTAFIRLTSCDEFPQCFGDTDWPTPPSCPTHLFQELIVAHPPPIDHAPQVLAPGSVEGSENAPISFEISASDPDSDPIGSLGAAPLPVGASFAPGGGSASGTFEWTPDFTQSGTYAVTFTASNVLSGSAVSTIAVADVNRAPLADAGGPYSGVVGVPVAFDGSNSSDPDGQSLQFTWDFGDNSEGSGPTINHAYATGGTYIVSLTVTDAGAPELSGISTTQANIAAAIPARIFAGAPPYKVIRLMMKKDWCVQIEAIHGDFDVSQVIPGSVALSYGTGRIQAASGKSDQVADTDGNGVQEIKVCFGKPDLRSLFAGLPPGKSSVVASLQGDLSTGGRFSGDLAIDVAMAGGHELATLVSPNPLNPDATITFLTARPGSLRVQIFDIHGRLVRTLMDDALVPPGYHDIMFDGRDAQGAKLASGSYLFQVKAAEGEVRGKLVILK